MPYVSPVPLESDVQPLCFVVSALALLAMWIFDQRKLRLDGQDAVIAAIAFVSLVYANQDAYQTPFEMLRRTSPMLLGLVIYLVGRHGRTLLSCNTALAACAIHAFAALAQAFQPELHQALFRPFLGTLRGSIDRGLAGATSEPSFLANIAILLPIVVWVMSAWIRVRRGHWIAVWGSTIVMFGLSQAATATVYGLLVFIAFSLTRGYKSAGITIATLSLLALFGPSLLKAAPRNRAIDLLNVAVDDPRMIIEDPSASMRLVGHYLAFPSLQENPLGTGDIKLNTSYFWDLWNKYNLDSMYQTEISRLSAQGYALVSGLTDLGANTMRMGWVFIVILILWFASYLGTRYSAVVLMFVALGVLSSIPISFPAYWFLLGMLVSLRAEPRLPGCHAVEPV